MICIKTFFELLLWNNDVIGVVSFKQSNLTKLTRAVSVIFQLAKKKRSSNTLHHHGFKKKLFVIHTWGVNLWNSETQLGRVERGAHTRKGPGTPISMM